MQIRLNGKDIEINDGLMISDIVKMLDIKTVMFAVEKNLEIVPKSEYSTTPITDGDKIEIVNFVGGG